VVDDIDISRKNRRVGEAACNDFQPFMRFQPSKAGRVADESEDPGRRVVQEDALDEVTAEETGRARHQDFHVSDSISIGICGQMI
jgi:hypothetical protein